jgi:hypothetical protein
LTPPKDRLLDLFVFAPAGIALTVAEDLPELVEKGRNRIEGQAATARVIGQFVVQLGCGELKKRFHQLVGPDATDSGPETAKPPQASRPHRVDTAQHKDTAPHTNTAQRNDAVPLQDTPASVEPASREAVRRVRPASNGRSDAHDLAIPAYDTLSASQVVKRLAGLSRDELLEVADHERANRHRATILNRAEQLLSDEPAVGAP